MTKSVKIDDNLIELIQSVRNRAEIFLLIYAEPPAHSLVATLLEDLYEDCQEIIEYCKEENNG